MHWIALAVVCAALIFVSYHSPKIGFGLLTALGLLIVTLYFLNPDESEDGQFPIPRESVTLTDMRAVESYGEAWNYTGRVSNASDVSLTDLLIKIKLHDCPKNTTESSPECVIIGEDVDFVGLNVPPRQARDIDDTISFRNAVPKGDAKWEFELVGVRVSE